MKTKIIAGIAVSIMVVLILVGIWITTSNSEVIITTSISLDKSEYKFNESIIVTVNIANDGSDSVMICGDLEDQYGNHANLFELSYIKFTITDPNGNILNIEDFGISGIGNAIKLKPGESIVQSYDITPSYDFQNVSGNYSIVAKFQMNLKPDEQNLISLRFYEKLSYAEIGEILKKKEGAVKVQTHRLLKKLRKKIEKEIDNERS